MDRKVMNNAGWQCSLHRKTVIGLMMLAILPIAGGAGAVPEEEWNRTFRGQVMPPLTKSSRPQMMGQGAPLKTGGIFTSIRNKYKGG
jgi:hypothetical protein